MGSRLHHGNCHWSSPSYITHQRAPRSLSSILSRNAFGSPRRRCGRCTTDCCFSLQSTTILLFLPVTHRQTVISTTSLPEAESPSHSIDHSGCASTMVHEKLMADPVFNSRQNEIENMLYEQTSILLEQRRNRPVSQNNELL